MACWLSQEGSVQGGGIGLGKEVFIEIAIFRLTFYEVFMKVDLVRHCVLR